MNDRVKTIVDYILRFLFGGVFIFSGFVKAIDPMGTAYKVEEYINVFGMSFLTDIAGWLPLFIAVVLCVMEFMVGVMMLLHIYNKPIRWIAICFMTFFTITTFIDALTNKVDDCGCFGDAVKLTNWQTFWKNIILDVILVGICYFDKKTKEDYSKKLPLFTTIIFLILITIFSIRNIVYEPIVDFRPWKVGNKMAPTIDQQNPPITYATYKNVTTGEEKEFSMEAEGENTLMAAYAEDSLFAEHWQYVEGKNRVVGNNTINASGFSLTSYGETKDEALEILGDTTADLYMVAVWNMDKVNDKGMKRMVKYLKTLPENSHIIIVTASSMNKWLDFINKYGVEEYMFYSCDDKAIKAMIRSNPGVVHLSKTIVKEKFSFRQLPKQKSK
ncbi:MAG: DoxX family protein [Bacteroidales bacterium]|nr:DoxX family protein [Bacteroidales bacterium]